MKAPLWLSASTVRADAPCCQTSLARPAARRVSRGRVSRLTGRVPGGGTYDCHYRDGALDTGRSQNAAQCPKASELQRAD